MNGIIKLLVLSCLLVPSSRAAQPPLMTGDKPLWEAGVAGIAGWLPDYPGSDEGKARYLPIPYFLYRGPVLRADEDGGLRGRFFHESRWEVDLSASAAFPADDEGNRARRGMDDLDWIGELGPRLVYQILPRDAENKFTFSIPLHVVFSTDFGRLDGRGFLTSPYLLYQDENFFHPRLKAAYSLGFVFGTRSLNEYFYAVTEEDVTAERPYYEAKAGFMGTEIGLGFLWEVNPDLWLAIGYQGSQFQGTANESSPLMKARWTNAGAVAIIWRFYESVYPGYN